MTISAVTPRLRYVGSGTAGPFAYTWKIHAATDLKVYRVVLATGVETLLTYPADYSVAGVGAGGGGTITLTATIAATHAIVVLGMPALEQQLNLQNFNDFPAETMEDWLDRIVRMVQFTWDRASRAPYLGETDIDGAGDYNARGNRLSNLGAPVDDNDAVTKVYYVGTFLPLLQAQVTLAEGHANAASVSAAAAAASAVLSAGHVVTAAAHVATALGHANAAAVSAAAADASVIVAAGHVVSAQAARDLAYLWANEAEDVVVAGGQYSAYHWAQKAEAIVLGGLTAALVPFVPNGDIAANNVQTAVQEVRDDAAAALGTHAGLTNNPHAVTKSQVGLGNVTNDAQVKKAANSTDQRLMQWSGAGGDTPAAGGLAIPAGGLVGVTEAQTLTNKTLTDPVYGGSPREAEYTVVDAAGVAINPRNGGSQLWTLGASRTPTAAGWASGDEITLYIADGTAFAVTWTTMGIVWKDNIAPTLPTTGYAEINIKQHGSVLRGVHVGNWPS